MKLLNRVSEQHVANSVIADPEEHTVMDEDGSVRSIQAANITMPEAELEQLWSPMNLERLARTYWKYLSRVTLGLIRVEYTAAERAVVLLHRPLVDGMTSETIVEHDPPDPINQHPLGFEDAVRAAL